MDFYCSKSQRFEPDLKENWQILDDTSHYFRLELNEYKELFRNKFLDELNQKTVLSLEYGESEEIGSQEDKLQIINVLHSLLNSTEIKDELKISLQAIQRIFLFGYMENTIVHID